MTILPHFGILRFSVAVLRGWRNYITGSPDKKVIFAFLLHFYIPIAFHTEMN